MNNKGFTLVELLAMLVVLAILMGIAIPNITGILANNKLNVMKADATKMVDTAKLKFSRIAASERPKSGECVIYALNYLNDSGDITNGPNGGRYLQFDSFIIVSREASKYGYYIRLIEEDGAKRIGINVEERSVLSQGETDYIKSISESELFGLGGDKEGDKTILDSKEIVRNKCPNGVIDYYPGRVLN
ncbi:MAG: prepilin-type N-terminal cleavage/methylation domain-containing protein [Bacilli bacterium]|nr:prepilin-type N-terminal cleavage/methylation domain-containing protein [Bacilli bacterium]